MTWISACALAVAPLFAEAAPERKPASSAKRGATVQKKAPAPKKPAAAPRAKKSSAVKASTRNIPKRAVSVVASARPQAPVVERLSLGRAYGLHEVDDPLALQSSVALVLDQDTNEIIFSKNEQAVLPIASLTKLMTALVVTEARLPLDEVLTITQDDVDTLKGSSSRLAVGTQLTRGEMLHLALMSSENRAANALGRHYPGGLSAFVAAMNRKAAELGMSDTRYVEPTGLSSDNQSSARDLATLVRNAYGQALIRDLSTSPEYQVAIGKRHLQYRNTNGLVYNPGWSIGLQKTGYISEAGRCLVMQAELSGRKLIMVFLDSAGRHSRLADAERVRKWLEGATQAIVSR
ncbi:D-alanyl-D-alanine endopeptidase [Caldimonas tepidiphila]|uniref:D-alanyl-D-alanine endopeptidase n=1 Tax=Caldimonas tepidiphila TaxID=2315841 RepID=UPI003AF4061F